MQIYRNFIEKYIQLTDEEWNSIKSIRYIKKYKKGEIILHQGDICKELNFISRGLARGFLINEQGKDYTWNIFFNDENSEVNNLFVLDYKSFLLQQESSFQIEALEDVELISVSLEKHLNSINSLRKGMDFSYMICNEAYIYLHDLVLERQTKSAKERFESFMQKTPFLLNKVPQYQIASYLGITPQHLSRLKNSYEQM